MASGVGTVELVGGVRVRGGGVTDAAPVGKEVKTLYDLVRTHSLSLGQDRNAIAFRKDGDWTSITITDALSRAEAISQGLVTKEVEEGAVVPILSAHRYEAALTTLALVHHSRIPLLLHSDIHPHTLTNILTTIAPKCAFADNKNSLDRLKAACPSIKEFFLFDAECEDVGVTSLEQVEESGDVPPHTHDPPKPNDVAILILNGAGKIVPLTHANLVAQTASFPQLFAGFKPDPSDTLLSTTHFSDPSHRSLEMASSVYGFKLVYGSSLATDGPAVSPTIILSKPNELADLRRKAFAIPGVKEAFTAKERSFTSISQDPAFSLARDLLGKGPLKLVLVGESPLSLSLANFVRVVFGCPIVELFAAAEAGIVSYADPKDLKTAGNVGAPASGLRVQLIGLPGLGVSAAEGIGEVAVSGSGVATGYWKESGKKEWMGTGTVGTWTEKGCLRVLGGVGESWKLVGKETGSLGVAESVWRCCELVESVFGVEKGGKTGALVVSKAEKGAVMAGLKSVVEESGVGTWAVPCNVVLVKTLTLPVPLIRCQVAKEHAASIALLFP